MEELFTVESSNGPYLDGLVVSTRQHSPAAAGNSQTAHEALMRRYVPERQPSQHKTERQIGRERPNRCSAEQEQKR